MVKFCLTTILASVFMLIGNLSAQSFWDMKPEEVRKLFNEKAFAIKAETPERWKCKKYHDKTGWANNPLAHLHTKRSQKSPYHSFHSWRSMGGR